MWFDTQCYSAGFCCVIPLDLFRCGQFLRHSHCTSIITLHRALKMLFTRIMSCSLFKPFMATFFTQIAAHNIGHRFPTFFGEFNNVTHFNGFSRDFASDTRVCVKARKKAIKRLHLTEAHNILRRNLGYRSLVIIISHWNGSPFVAVNMRIQIKINFIVFHFEIIPTI